MIRFPSVSIKHSFATNPAAESEVHSFAINVSLSLMSIQNGVNPLPASPVNFILAGLSSDKLTLLSPTSTAAVSLNEVVASPLVLSGSFAVTTLTVGS